MQFYIVDVFAEKKYAGNQLAVVRGGASLSDITMQQIAQEMNYSETTFILNDSSRNGGYDVRIFTPAEEVSFAGHPTLGTSYIIQQKLIGTPINQVTLNLQVGQIPVEISYTDAIPDLLWMHQKSPEFGETFAAETMAAVLKIDVTEIDTRFPIQDVSTGLPFIIVPIKTLAAVKRSRIDLDLYQALIAQSRAKAIHLFCPQTYKAENDLNARMFAPHFDVIEDPATGSANGCLAGYLMKHHYFGTSQIDIRVEQGYEIGRPSLLLLRAQQSEAAIEVFVGGQVVMVAEGRLV